MSFDWVAPSAGTGEVVFYGGFNSNFEGHKDGDKTYLSTLKVMEKTNSVQPSSQTVLGFTTYPNPGNQVLNVKFAIKKSSILFIDIVDMTGKQVAVIMNEKANGEVAKQINTSSLSNGNYLIRLQADGSSISKKLIITH